MFSPISLLFCILLSNCYTAYSSIILATQGDDFLECLTLFNSHHANKVEVYAPNNGSYMSILRSSIRNLRFASPQAPKPLFIVAPRHDSQVQATVVCSRKHGLQIRVRSGGHDFEGLSYTSNVPFVMIDLANLRAINVDIKDNSSWVQAGASIGELYYKIAKKSPIHGFPAGFTTTVGVGGHFSVGGIGAMMRKYGVAADHIVDAKLVNANGEILNRETMGEDLFWAIRGGGAANFGIVLAFKIKLVQVPPVVTFSKVTFEQDELIEIFHKWQYVASHEVPKELFIQVSISPMPNNNIAALRGFRRVLHAKFQMLFLGPSEELIHLMKEKFPELGIKKKDCTEMSWIESVIALGDFPTISTTIPLDVLLDRTRQYKVAFKAKSDFVTTPMSKIEVQKVFNKFLEEEKLGVTICPYGGKMNEISEDEIAFPHRAGNMYVITYMSYWDEEEENTEASQVHIKWMREMFNYMGPYVSKDPRAAYLGTRDLDLGHNINGIETPKYSEARIWGEKYFKGNFEKLVKVKSEVDPDNFFCNEQSIPPITSQSVKREELLTIS